MRIKNWRQNCGAECAGGFGRNKGRKVCLIIIKHMKHFVPLSRGAKAKKKRQHKKAFEAHTRKRKIHFSIRKLPSKRAESRGAKRKMCIERKATAKRIYKFKIFIKDIFSLVRLKIADHMKATLAS